MHRLTTLSLLTALAALAATPAQAQDLGHKAPPQINLVAIVGGTVHPVASADIPSGAVWFLDGTVAGVGTAADLAAFLSKVRLSSPPTTIDASGRHVYPGLIAPYTQLGLVEFPPIVPSDDRSESGNITPEVRPAIAVNPDSTVIPVTRSNGILLAGVFPLGGTIAGQVSVIRLDGWTTPDMTVDPSVGVSLRWPNLRPFNPWWAEPRSDEDQAKEIRQNQKAIVDAFDAAQAYATAKSGDAHSPIDLRWEGMMGLFGPTPDTRKTLYVTANDTDQINAAVTFAAERGVKVVILGGQEAPRCAELLKKHDVPVVVMGTHRMPRRSDSPYDDGYSLPRELHAAGIRFAIASADDTAHERNLPYMAAMAVAHGLPHDAALRSITLSAAEVLGVSSRYGSIETGKSATLIVTTGDPMEVTSKVEWAFVDGRQIDLANKQTKLYDKYRERYRQTGDIKESSPR